MKSLKSKILITILIVIFVSNFAITGIAYYISKTELTKSSESDLRHVTESVSAQLDDINRQEFKMLKSIASLPRISSTETPMYEKYEVVQAITQTDSSYIGGSILDATGDGYIENQQIVNFAERDYYKEAMKGRNYIEDPFINKVTQQLAMFYAAPVYDSNHKVQNVLFTVYDGYVLSSVVKGITVGKKSTPIVINRKTGKIIADGDRKVVADGTNIKTEEKDNKGFDAAINEITAGKTGITYYRNADGKSMVAAYQPVPNTNWAVLIQVPASDFQGGITLMLQFMIITFVIILILSIILSGTVVGRSVKPLLSVKKSVSMIASGKADLTQRIEITTKDEIGAVVNGFNTFTGKLQSIIADIKDSRASLSTAGEDLHAITEDTSASITQIITSIGGVNDQIIGQAAGVEETAGAVNEIASNIASLERMIENQSSGVTEASAAVEQMIGNIGSVNQTMEKMAAAFKDLDAGAQSGYTTLQDANERIQQIEGQSDMLQEANTAIANIANQTNLLAMNAAIEAAHAGEAGKGFSVVADEIRKLSETSQEQSKTIGEQLSRIKESIEAVVSASSESNTAFLSVSEKIRTTDELVRQIKEAMQEQQEGSKQIGEALHSMNDSTQEVRTASTEMSAGNQAILEEVQRLQEATSAIKSSISEMQSGAKKINEAGTALSGVSENLQGSIQKIGNQIDQFKV